MSRISLSCTVLGLAAAEGPLLRLRNSAGSDDGGEALQESAAGSIADSYTGTSSSSSSRDSDDVRGNRGGRRPPRRTEDRSESVPSELVSKRESTMSLRQLQPEQYCTSTGESLSENEKVCLQTCHVIDGEIHPRFYQWEEYLLIRCKQSSRGRSGRCSRSSRHRAVHISGIARKPRPMPNGTTSASITTTASLGARSFRRSRTWGR
mmetsp:Transcript_13608/g.33464  ORF Transcript_13608/g.33464 Transcript_13608/m.33464 type:complete len:207 (-) Transcript_13608:740-1360(-)